jgi:hypothetical protein
VLTKASSNPYDAEWDTPTVGGGSVVDATTSIKGVVQLAGDLGGTAAAPTVPGLAAKANTASLATVATSGAYTDLSGKPTLGTAAAQNTTAFDAAGAATTAQAFAVQRANHTGTQAASTITGLATVATSGAYADLSGKPTINNGPDIYLPAPSGDSTGATDAAAINTAINTAATAGGGRVVAKPGVTYQVGIQGTVSSLGPSGTTGPRSYCVLLKSGVTLDMQNSTLQLRGSTEASIIFPEHGDGVTRDHDLGLVNAVLDGRNVTSTSHSVLQMGYVDRLTLRRVKVINFVYQAGWVFATRGGVFTDLDCDTGVGQGWTFGDPRATGVGANQVYDSTFGDLRASNITLLNTVSQPGNPYNLVLTRCTIGSIRASNCSAGIKIQQPSTDVVIGLVQMDTCGEATALNSGFKLQGDATYPAGTDRPTRIRVGQVIATNQANVGLYLWHTQDCSVDSYAGYNNCLLHTASSDVILGGGINDHISALSTRNSGGAGVRISNDNGGATAGPTGYRLPNVRVTNPGQNSSGSIKSGFRIDANSSGTIGEMILVDDQGTHTMDKGVDVTVAGASATFGALSISGQTGTAFNSSSAGVAQPTAGIKNNYTATSDPLVTSDSASGYSVGSTWVNTTTKVAFECLDATASAAVWRRLVADVQVFTASGTWTRPTWASTTTVSMLGAGGGGGAGARGPASTARVGGGGGGGAAFAERTFQTSDLTATVSVTLGAIGTGGAAQTTDGTAGANGTTGGASQFASFLRVGGGNFGTGGGLAGTAGGAGSGAPGPVSGANGGAGAATGGAGGAGASALVGAGGGAGGGISSGNTDNAGGAGSPMTSNGGSAGAAGTATGGAGGGGGASTATQSVVPGGGGGGGGGSSTTAAGAGGAGGNYGAGGGGGGASLNGFNSGAGGNGAPGICVVVSR